ncbi:S8 family peptidase [Parahaliea mediterranea]|uniref:S8 family peptidase n=1 Tax=Parahaliea mediterranea TaxID=651086 RepID=A0A939DCM7_9GAMM|nr:S8 family peptidase [Parahaliea mediterranea]MBN7795127.1 S8 family peptidase [Parahaliea mediterranea]
MLKHNLALALLAVLALSPLTGQADEAPLRVMLQGESSSQLSTLVELKGGTVTHNLHIINAVGALVSRQQLEAIVDSPLVSRHIDDLSLTPPPPVQEACNVGGALELDFDKDALHWRLYNKGSDTVALETLRMHWPGRLGELRKATLDGTDLMPGQSLPPGPDKVELTVPQGIEARINSEHLLTFQFSHFKGSPPSIEQHEIDLEAEFTGGCVTELIPGYAEYGSDTYYPTVSGAAELHQHGVTGRGVAVAVLDSGLWEHENLTRDTRGRQRIAGRYDAIADIADSEVFDESGHGTHMTSVLANSGAVTRKGAPENSFMGIAPDVDIVAVKAFNKTGKGDFLDIVRGIQWVVDNRERLGIRVLNLSFAARPRWPYWLDPINQALMRAWQAGIVVVAAAGNEGPDAMTVGSPGNLPYIITVGAVTDSWTPNDRNDDYVPDFSSRGPTPSGHIKPDIVAPGGHISGITRPGSTLTQEHPDYLLNNGEFVMTGTSQASALVSGIASLLLQLEPDLTPDDVKCKLISSAEFAINRDGRLAYSPFQQGNGYASATRAVTLGKRGCGNVDMDLAQEIDNIQHYEGPAIITEDGSATLPGLSELYAGKPSAKGPSDDRRWGVKAHIERKNGPSPEEASPIDWTQHYLEEKSAIDRLARQRPAHPGKAPDRQ